MPRIATIVTTQGAHYHRAALYYHSNNIGVTKLNETSSLNPPGMKAETGKRNEYIRDLV
ncbi:hypothetical protein [Vibrio phage J14]|nr:hypothetical protein [Vibrio phage J14]